MSRNRQAGMSSMLAIFLVTVLAVLATAGIQMTIGTRNDATLDMQLQRARSAARAGVEVAFFNARSGACTNAAINDLPETLVSFTVSVVCTPLVYTDGAPSNVQVLRIQATACNRPASGAVACPNNAASASDLYVEAVENGECVIDATGTRCRRK